MIYDDQNTRRHFEAAIAGIAEMYSIDPLDVRDAIKDELTTKGMIRLSTTELTEDELKSVANKLTAYKFHQDETPPEWKWSLDEFMERLPEILFSKP